MNIADVDVAALGQYATSPIAEFGGLLAGVTGILTALATAWVAVRNQTSSTKSSDVDAAVKLSTNAMEIAKQLQESLNGQIEALREQGEATERQMKVMMDACEKLVTENRELQRVNEVLRSENVRLEKAYRDLQEQLERVEAENLKLSAEVGRLGDQVRAIDNVQQDVNRVAAEVMNVKT